jgi:hypothetical protein
VITTNETTEKQLKSSQHHLVKRSGIFVDYIFVRLNLTQLPANNLRRISTMYVRGYLQGSENGRVVTIVGTTRLLKDEV